MRQPLPVSPPEKYEATQNPIDHQQLVERAKLVASALITTGDDSYLLESRLTRIGIPVGIATRVAGELTCLATAQSSP